MKLVWTDPWPGCLQAIHGPYDARIIKPCDRPGVVVAQIWYREDLVVNKDGKDVEKAKAFLEKEIERMESEAA